MRLIDFIQTVFESDIPETNYGYWILPTGEIRPVAPMEHAAEIPQFNRSYVSAFRAGWIRIVWETAKEFVVNLNAAKLNNRSFQSLIELLKHAEQTGVGYFRFQHDSTGRDEDAISGYAPNAREIISRLRQIWQSQHLREKLETVLVGFTAYKREIPTLIGPSARELAGFVQRTRHGEARALLVASPSQSERTLVVWDAFEADHDEMKTALKPNGWRATGSPNLEFSSENRGYGSRDITRSGLVQYGPIWGTRSRMFADTFIARMLMKIGNVQTPNGVTDMR